jgi:hypothetical protein
MGLLWSLPEECPWYNLPKDIIISIIFKLPNATQIFDVIYDERLRILPFFWGYKRKILESLQLQYCYKLQYLLTTIGTKATIQRRRDFVFTGRTNTGHEIPPPLFIRVDDGRIGTATCVVKQSGWNRYHVEVLCNLQERRGQIGFKFIITKAWITKDGFIILRAE